MSAHATGRRLALVVVLLTTLFASIGSVLTTSAVGAGSSGGCKTAETGRCKDEAAKKKEKKAASPLEQPIGRNDDFTKNPTGDAKKEKGETAVLPLGTGASCNKNVRSKLGLVQRAACESTGVPFVRHPVENYQLDEHVNGDAIDGALGGDGNPGNELIVNAQNGIWMFWTWIFFGLLAMLEWATHLDTFANGIFSEIGTGIARINRDIGWIAQFLSLIMLVGGFVIAVGRDRVGVGLRGFGESWLYVLITLAIVSAPMATIGAVASDSGKMTRTVMGSTTKTPDGAAKGSTDAKSAGVLDQSWQLFVERMFALQQFGDVGWGLGTSGHDGKKIVPVTGEVLARQLCDVSSAKACDQQVKDDDFTGKPKVMALFATSWYGRYRPVDIWAAWPKSDGGVRDALYEFCRDKKDHPCHSRILIQQGNSVWYPKLVAGALGGSSLVGAALLFFVVACHIIFQLGKSAVLLLISPAMSLVGASGEEGRHTWRRWGIAFLETLMWAAVAALFIAIVVFVLTAIATKTTITATGGDVAWVVYLGFIAAITWGALIWYSVNLFRRKFGSKAKWRKHASKDKHRLPPYIKNGKGQRSVSPRSGSSYGSSSTAKKIAAPLKAAVNQTRDRAAAKAQTGLVDDAGRTLGTDARKAQEWEQTRKPAMLRERRSLDTSLKAYDRRHAEASANGKKPPEPTKTQARLIKRRDEIDHELASPRAAQAEALTREVARGQGVIPERLVAERKEQRLALARDKHTHPAEPGYLKAIGIYDQYQQSDQTGRSDITRRAARQLKADRTTARKIDRAQRRGDTHKAFKDNLKSNTGPVRAGEGDAPQARTAQADGPSRENRKNQSPKSEQARRPESGGTATKRPPRVPDQRKQPLPGESLKKRLQQQKDQPRKRLR